MELSDDEVFELAGARGVDEGKTINDCRRRARLFSPTYGKGKNKIKLIFCGQLEK